MKKSHLFFALLAAFGGSFLTCKKNAEPPAEPEIICDCGAKTADFRLFEGKNDLFFQKKDSSQAVSVKMDGLKWTGDKGFKHGFDFCEYFIELDFHSNWGSGGQNDLHFKTWGSAGATDLYEIWADSPSGFLAKFDSYEPSFSSKSFFRDTLTVENRTFGDVYELNCKSQNCEPIESLLFSRSDGVVAFRSKDLWFFKK